MKLESCPRLVRNLVSLWILTAALLLAVSPSGFLGATQESAPPDLTVDIPNDMSGEAIEEQFPDLAGQLNPVIITLFDVAEPAANRLTAASQLEGLITQIGNATPQAETLGRRLSRRTALLKAAIQASESMDLASGPGQLKHQLPSAVTGARSALQSMVNGENWIKYLHLSELESSAASSELMQRVLANLTPVETMNQQQLNFLRRPALQELKAELETAIAAGTSVDPAAAKMELQVQVHELVTSALAWEKEPIAARADVMRSAWRRLRSRFPVPASILRPVVNLHYFNHNVHFTVSEELLSRLVSDYRTERGCIADCVMGAWVTGAQTTNVDVDVDIVPSLNTAQFQLNVRGNTLSNTKAQKDPATIWTNGNHYFWMNRSVFFDGRHVSASPATFSVNTNSRTVGLATKFDGIPIIRGIVRRIATQKIAEAKPQSDAITASKLRDEALPKFESETDQQFSEGNSTLQKTLDSMERRGVAPDSFSARSSNTQLAVSSRTIGITKLGGSLQPPATLISAGASAQIHQSILNNAIDALDFQGRSIPEKDFLTELETALSELAQRDIKLSDGQFDPAPAGEEPEPPSTFVFSKTDPIRVRFDNGEVILVLRTGIRQEGREEIPEQTITIPIRISIAGGKLILEPGNIAVGGTDNARKVQIKRILSRRIIRRELNATVDLQAAGDKTLPVTLTRIELLDGWMSTEMQ